MADELVERLEKQAHICRTSKTIGLITKARSADAMQHAAARIQSDAAEIEGLQCALSEANTERMEQARLLGMSAERELALRAEVAEARGKALEEAAKVALNPGFIQARDDGWDTGFNDAKRIIAQAIRDLARR